MDVFADPDTGADTDADQSMSYILHTYIAVCNEPIVHSFWSNCVVIVDIFLKSHTKVPYWNHQNQKDEEVSTL